jgi:hypothetical protein
MRRIVTLANEPLDRRQRLAKISIQDAGMSRYKSHETDGFRHACQDKPTALSLGK